MLQPIELKVPMCCEKCAKKVKDRLEDLEGVENVITDQYNQKVTVFGDVEPGRVLNRVKLVKKRSAFWDMAVDYSENYRRYRAAVAEQARKEAARAAERAAQEAEAAKAAKLVHTRAPPVVVQMAPDRHGPAVTAILPPDRPMPYMAHHQMGNVRYVSPPRMAYRQDRFYDGRWRADRPLY